MQEENRPLVAIEPVEVQEFGKTTHLFLSNPWRTILQIDIEKPERSQHVTNWTWKH
jgi:hypothetical protein